MPEQHDVMTVDEAADYLRTSRWTLYALVRRGDLPERRAGAQLRFYPADLDAYLGRTAPLPTSEARAAAVTNGAGRGKRKAATVKAAKRRGPR